MPLQDRFQNIALMVVAQDRTNILQDKGAKIELLYSCLLHRRDRPGILYSEISHTSLPHHTFYPQGTARTWIYLVTRSLESKCLLGTNGKLQNQPKNGKSLGHKSLEHTFHNSGMYVQPDTFGN